MLRDPIRYLPLIALLLLPAAASAQKIFICKDPVTGRTLTSDRPLPECAQTPVRELRKDGSTLRVIPPPPTAEQRQAKAAEEAKQKQEELDKAEQKRRDQALLAAYSSEDSLQKARARQIAQQEDDIKRARQRLAQAEKNLAEAQKDAKPYDKQKLPFGIEQRLMQGDLTIKAEQTVIDSKRAEIEKINQKFDADLARFRELTGSK